LSTDQPTPPAPLAIKVVNGNLLFVAPPLMLGHYRSMVLTGTERVMDRLLGGALQTALALGCYPDRPGTAEVFVNTGTNPRNPLLPPRPQAVVVVGMGEEGGLDSEELATTVCQGVLAWAKRRSETRDPDASPFALAATLMGSGGTGMSAGQAARQVVQGVLRANERLGRLGKPGVGQLEFVELFLDRASEAWRALREQEGAAAGRWKLQEVIDSGPGALHRPLDASYRGAAYDMIAAKSVRGEDGASAVAFVLDTKRARTEVHAHSAQVALIRALVAGGANHQSTDPEIGRTLFRLLVPVELEPFLAGSTETLLEVDGGTAGLPWEMLTASESDSDDGGPPWAIRAKLLRKLQTRNFRPQVVHGDDALALVIGEPICPPAYARLPGARAEASAVADCLEANLGFGQVRREFSPRPDDVGPNFRRVMNAIQARDWRIIHITGHGEAPREATATAPASSGGVVLSEGFFGPAEVESLRAVPELVFVNCCYLAKRDPHQLLDEEPATGADRPRFAGSMAEALIGLGVRCVIAAGWAVKDDGAAEFATTFYQRLTTGSRFIDAVAEARSAARLKGGNSWAAYQCYGDPDWTLKRKESDTPAEPPPPDVTFAHVASPTALILALETLTVTSRYVHKEPARLRASLAHLEERFGPRWGSMGSVSDAFGAAWAECDRVRAIDWYRRAVAANDGGASLRAAEQLGNLRARVAEEAVADPRKRGSDPAAALEGARGEIRGALDLLRAVNAVQPSIERESLCGSAWKRLAMVELLAEAPDQAQQAIAGMKEAYLRAEALARQKGDPDLYYPALNGMVAELIVDGARDGWTGFAPDRLAEVQTSLEKRTQNAPDFWSFVSLIDLRLYQAIAGSRLASERTEIEGLYQQLHERVRSSRDWASVRDQVRFLLSARRSWANAEQSALQALLERLDGFAAEPP
jgi:hypothetical protein